jgi:ornithine cyclodeaminase/alanine dehydrogenase-like protein (mu-crystallin family)
MDGALPRIGVHALRLTSDLTHEAAGRRTKLAAAPGERYVGLVVLFDIETLVPLAIVQDGYLQRMRVGATSALAADLLARRDARTAGVVGAGWQAGAQIAGLRAVRGLDAVRVYAPTRDKLEAFCEEHGAVPVASVREAIAGADVVVLATNSHEPVLDGAWLEPGQHVTSIVGSNIGLVRGGFARQPRREIDDATLHRAALIVVANRAQVVQDEQGDLFDPIQRGVIRFDDLVELGALVAGSVAVPSDPRAITLFKNNAGQGVADIALYSRLVQRARERGFGTELPLDG